MVLISSSFYAAELSLTFCGYFCEVFKVFYSGFVGCKPRQHPNSSLKAAMAL